MLSEASDGLIEVEEHRATGQIALEYGMPAAKIQASAKNAGDSKTVEKKLAPKSLLVASGTLDRAHGVFFILHPSSQDSLQKSRQFVCQFAVPADFRGDYVQIACTAVASERSFGHSKEAEVVAGNGRFTVGIHLAGEPAARRAAERLAAAQQNLAAALVRREQAVRATPPHHWWQNVSQTVMHVGHAKPSLPAADAADPTASNVNQAAHGLQAAQEALRRSSAARSSNLERPPQHVLRLTGAGGLLT